MTRKVNEPEGLTPQERLLEWNAFCAKFHKDLTDRPGTVLPAAWRLAIVEAVESALGCKGCNSVGDACLRPGTAFSVLSSLDHAPALRGLGDASDKEKQLVLHVVHAIVNQQTKVDEQWYQKVSEQLDHTSFIPSTLTGESRRGLIATLVAEILGLTVVAHGIDISYRALKKDPPPMPRLQDVKDAALEPTFLDIASMLKPGRSFRYDKQGAGWAPLVEYGDLDTEAMKRFFNEKDLAHLKERMIGLVPFCILNVSPHELMMVELFFNTFGYDQKDIMKPFVALDPQHHCAGFSRYDKETVAGALSETYNCGY